MKAPWVMHRALIVALAACGHSNPAPAPAPTQADFDTAYNAGKFDDCARIAKQAAATPGPKQSTWLYNEACCEARGAKPDAAFASFDRALAAGLHDRSQLEKDEDLASLHTDARWQPFLDKVAAADANILASIAEPKLREELHALVDVDQKARFAAIAAKDDHALAEKVDESDRHSTQRMHEIIAQYGWPGKKLVGDDGAHDAWLLVQHADKDPAFQKQCLALMRAVVRAGEVAPIDVAYLEDRVAVADKRPQTYGTQFGPDGQPQPMIDPDHIDERRAAVGLGTMAAYREQMRKMYGSSIK
ncbi:MAG: hypothetical protein QM831_18220 [Kofleriaceae bacterium]